MDEISPDLATKMERLADLLTSINAQNYKMNCNTSRAIIRQIRDFFKQVAEENPNVFAYSYDRLNEDEAAALFLDDELYKQYRKCIRIERAKEKREQLAKEAKERRELYEESQREIQSYVLSEAEQKKKREEREKQEEHNRQYREAVKRRKVLDIQKNTICNEANHISLDDLLQQYNKTEGDLDKYIADLVVKEEFPEPQDEGDREKLCIDTDDGYVWVMVKVSANRSGKLVWKYDHNDQTEEKAPVPPPRKLKPVVIPECPESIPITKEILDEYELEDGSLRQSILDDIETAIKERAFIRPSVEGEKQKFCLRGDLKDNFGNMHVDLIGVVEDGQLQWGLNAPSGEVEEDPPASTAKTIEK